MTKPIKTGNKKLGAVNPEGEQDYDKTTQRNYEFLTNLVNSKVLSSSTIKTLASLLDFFKKCHIYVAQIDDNRF